MTIDQEKIDALLDGALNADDAAALEVRIAADPSALKMLGESTLLNLTLKRVIGDVPEDISFELPDTNQLSALESANDNEAGWRFAFPTIAASLMIVAAGVAGFFGGQINGPDPARLEAALGSVHLAKTETFVRALEQLKSGEMANWRDGDTGWSGAITPLRTYKAKDARWCREYRTVEQFGKSRSVRMGLACRVGEGEWQTELERLAES